MLQNYYLIIKNENFRSNDMKTLLVAATEFEIAPLLPYKDTLGFDTLVTGLGQMMTAYHTGIALQHTTYALVINAGIAGSFRRDWELGKVVNVVSEQFGDLGVENEDGTFTDVAALGFLEKNAYPFHNGMMINQKANEFDFLTKANGLTVNKVHGYEPSILAIQQKYQCDIETMEGAGFFYACLMQKVNFIAIRSLSNYVEKRNRAAWKIGEAIESLNAVMYEILKEIQ